MPLKDFLREADECILKGHVSSLMREEVDGCTGTKGK